MEPFIIWLFLILLGLIAAIFYLINRALGIHGAMISNHWLIIKKHDERIRNLEGASNHLKPVS